MPAADDEAEHDADDEDLPEELEDDDPVKDIFRIIRRYYKGLKREQEGMGAD